PVVVDLDRSIDPADRLEGPGLPAGMPRRDAHGLARRELVVDGDVEPLGAVEAEALVALAHAEAERQYAHPDQVAAVDALEGDRDHGAHAEQVGALRGPVARRSHPVVPAREPPPR